MDSLRKWFSFNKGERIAVVSILICLVMLVLACLLRRPRVAFDSESLHDLDSMLALRQSALETYQQQKAAKSDEGVELQPFPFNPNTMTEEEGRQLGLTERQIRNIINYRDKGGKFYAKSDFGKLYTISEEDFAQLEPFIVLPEVSRRTNVRNNSEKPQHQEVKEEKKTGTPKAIPIVDLNTADSATLVELPQVGPYTAVRILEFRDKLGGFVDKAQLRDVKGMDSARFEAVRPYIKIGEANVLRIDVNRVDFKTMVSHPYLSYNQVKRIVNQRERRGMIKDWNQLQALFADEEPLNPLLEHYVKY